MNNNFITEQIDNKDDLFFLFRLSENLVSTITHKSAIRVLELVLNQDLNAFKSLAVNAFDAVSKQLDNKILKADDDVILTYFLPALIKALAFRNLKIFKRFTNLARFSVVFSDENARKVNGFFTQNQLNLAIDQAVIDAVATELNKQYALEYLAEIKDSMKKFLDYDLRQFDNLISKLTIKYKSMLKNSERILLSGL